MAGTISRISDRMVLALLIIHAVLLPAVYFGTLAIVKSGQQDAFVDHARISSRIVADVFENHGSLESESQTVKHLDSAVLGGRGKYAVLRTDNDIYMSSLMSNEDVASFSEDFNFGEHGDGVYYVSVPLAIENPGAVLQLGFDETPTLSQIEGVRLTLINILFVYFLVSLLLIAVLGALLARPLQRLRDNSRKIASGDYSRKLTVTSKIHEIRELTRDLETMRSNIVGVNEQLQKEIVEREAAEALQKQLEVRLRHSQRLDSIGTLAGGIAHEFNNIMLPVILYTDLAIEDLPEGSPALKNLERVLDLSNRAKGLSRQILTFGRPSGDAEKEYLDIKPVVEEALSMVRALIPATVEIRTDIENDAGDVYCDPTQIQQLVVNLCSNAFRSLLRGGYIHVRLGRAEVDQNLQEEYPKLSNGNFVCLSVADTGTGMDAATLERIFEPFFTTREVGQGTGLGLSVVHGIIERHEGQIIVTSEPGEGSTFRIFLPKFEQNSGVDRL